MNCFEWSDLKWYDKLWYWLNDGFNVFSMVVVGLLMVCVPLANLKSQGIDILGYILPHWKFWVIPSLLVFAFLEALAMKHENASFGEFLWANFKILTYGLVPIFIVGGTLGLILWVVNYYLMSVLSFLGVVTLSILFKYALYRMGKILFK